MFKIEVKFKVSDREVPFETFGLFITDVLKTALRENQLKEPVVFKAIHATPDKQARGQQLLSIEEAADQIGLKAPTIRTEIGRRRIACVRVGRRVLTRCKIAFFSFLFYFNRAHSSTAVCNVGLCSRQRG